MGALLMVEKRPLQNVITHGILILGIVVVIFPIYIAFVASTHKAEDALGTVHGWVGNELVENYSRVLKHGKADSVGAPVSLMMWNSLVMALGIVVGKISISILSAYAIVYFRFPFRNFFFWIIFMTLMLPVEVRILPTYKVVSDLGLLNSYSGLILPLIASATATFLFRQFFLTVPDELAEAARVDGAGPVRFFLDVLLPLSRTNIAALFVILFIYGWNQYLWPLLITADTNMTTIVMATTQMLSVMDGIPDWSTVMTTAIMALLPPVIVVVVMQRLFIKGLIETEK
jgi:sn-glycerol 3-phosphate transport system permease protein